MTTTFTTNPGALFSVEPPQNNGNHIPLEDWDNARYTRAVGPRPFYGGAVWDYDRDHRPKTWPGGTEYQYAYCSTYRPIQEQCRDAVPNILYQSNADSQPPQNHPRYKLAKTTPLPDLDLHVRNATYKPDAPLGVMVPEELTKVKGSVFGPKAMTMIEAEQTLFTPTYRYQDWVDRPLINLMRDCDIDCKIPTADRKYYDLYNEVRMHRPKKPVDPRSLYGKCRVYPLPLDKDVPSVPPLATNPHLGKMNNWALEDGAKETEYKKLSRQHLPISEHLTNIYIS